MYAEVAEYTKAGNFWDFLIGNVTLGQKASLFWAIGAGRFLQTAGLFLFGLYIGRKELFRNYRISFEVLDESTYYCSYQFRATVFSERTDHAK